MAIYPAFVNLEASAAHRGLGVTVGMAPARDARPGRLDEVLPARLPAPLRADMLEQAQRPRIAQHASDFGERRAWVGYAAEHEADRHRVEARGAERQGLGARADERNGWRTTVGAPQRVERRVDSHHPCGPWIPRQVAPRSAADLQRAPACAAGQPRAELPQADAVGHRHHRVVEQRGLLDSAYQDSSRDAAAGQHNAEPTAAPTEGCFRACAAALRRAWSAASAGPGTGAGACAPERSARP